MEKITAEMGALEIMSIMSEGNMGAAMVILQMLQDTDPRSFFDILLCDSHDIRGSKLYMLNNDCCGRDFGKFKRTLMMIRCGTFKEEQIHQNLDLVRAIPFIDEEIQIEGVPSYDVDFGPLDEKWDEYCAANKESFTKRLAKKVEEENQFRLQ